ncbi:hypothetical protein [Rubripirellula obstinata]|uniref:hypothetical protein n=1 Tax=Rubripirellula obstinata TaxID=406547 RepID=UPI00122C8735|nr:hypothetical protein [Rubripirellula obstinata]
MDVTHGDEVRADRSYRTGVLRITIACTGVAVARFSLCLHVKSRHLGDAYRYPYLCCGMHSTAKPKTSVHGLETVSQW